MDTRSDRWFWFSTLTGRDQSRATRVVQEPRPEFPVRATLRVAGDNEPLHFSVVEPTDRIPLESDPAHDALVIANFRSFCDSVIGPRRFFPRS